MRTINFAALGHLKSLHKRLSNDFQLKESYEQTLRRDLQKFYVNPVEMKQPEPDEIWYLPHHPVVNSNKLGKERRIASVAATFRGQSLDSNLITGPHLLYNFIGIPQRFFSENPIAILSDNEGMLKQIEKRHDEQSHDAFSGSMKSFLTKISSRESISGRHVPVLDNFHADSLRDNHAIQFPKAIPAR